MCRERQRSHDANPATSEQAGNRTHPVLAERGLAEGRTATASRPRLPRYRLSPLPRFSHRYVSHAFALRACSSHGQGAGCPSRLVEATRLPGAGQTPAAKDPSLKASSFPGSWGVGKRSALRT